MVAGRQSGGRRRGSAAPHEDQPPLSPGTSRGHTSRRRHAITAFHRRQAASECTVVTDDWFFALEQSKGGASPPKTPVCIRSLAACCSVAAMCSAAVLDGGRDAIFRILQSCSGRLEITAVHLLRLRSPNTTLHTAHTYLTCPYPEEIPSHNRCSPRPGGSTTGSRSRQFSSWSSKYSTPVPHQTCEMSCLANSPRARPGQSVPWPPPWPWLFISQCPCPASRRRADVQHGAHSGTSKLGQRRGSAHGTGARAPLSRGDQRPGPRACCGVGVPDMVRWGAWAGRPQAPVADMADTHSTSPLLCSALLCFGRVLCVWVDPAPYSPPQPKVMNGRVAAARTLPSTNGAARGRQAGRHADGCELCPWEYRRLVLLHASRTHGCTVSKRSWKGGGPLTYEAAASTAERDWRDGSAGGDGTRSITNEQEVWRHISAVPPPNSLSSFSHCYHRI